MALTSCRDLTAADWITSGDLSWQRLVCFGPAGFDAYARLRLLPDPVRPNQREGDAGRAVLSDQLPRLLEVLAGHTTTPGDCWFCVWDGYGRASGAAVPPPAVPRVEVPNRAYWLFRGPLADGGSWDSAAGWPGHQRLGDAEPAFVWPADRAWCVARDVDPHWAGIGSSRAVVDALVADPGLDVVPADPTEEQPAYR